MQQRVIFEIRFGVAAGGNQLELITRQQRAIRALSTPIIQLWDNIITLPLVGAINSERASEIMDRLLAEERTQPGDQAIQQRLGKQRASLFGCLYEPAAEPTNNRAERGFRWAVQARKLSCGNRAASGARSFEVLASVARTCTQRGHEFVSYLAQSLPMHLVPTPIPALAPTR